MAINLDGANHFISIGNYAEINGASACTICGWFNLQGNTPPTDPRIIEKNSGTGGASASFALSVKDNTLEVKSILSTSITTNNNIISNNTVSLTTWSWVAVTYDGSTHTLNWRDVAGQVETKTKALTGTIVSLADPAAIGGNPRTSSGTRIFDGDLADIRVYNRALSSAELDTIYNARGTDGITNSLKSRWLLNELAPGVNVPSASGAVKDIGPSQINGTTTIFNATDPTYSTDILRFRRRAS